jgi:hypothetical protein
VEADPAAEWRTTSDVAAYLGVQVGTVSSYRLRGQMPSPDLTVGRTHMWRPARIIEWHQSRPRPGIGGDFRKFGGLVLLSPSGRLSAVPDRHPAAVTPEQTATL